MMSVTMAHVDGSTSTDTFSVVVSDRRPPIGLGFDESENDVFDGGRHSRDFPGNCERRGHQTRYISKPTKVTHCSLSSI